MALLVENELCLHCTQRTEDTPKAYSPSLSSEEHVICQILCVHCHLTFIKTLQCGCYYFLSINEDQKLPNTPRF